MNDARQKTSRIRGRAGAILAMLLGAAFQFGGCGTAPSVDRFLGAYNQALDQFSTSFPIGF